MSLVPLIIDLLDDEPRYSFGYGYHPSELVHPRIVQRNSVNPYENLQQLYRQALRENSRRNRNNDSQLAQSHVGKDGFQVSLDVQHFLPNEISVKTVDNTVVIEGKHEEKEDEHGHIYRHFVRRYTLPKGFDAKDITSSLSSDGVLTVKAPPHSNAIESNERVVQIQQTGPAHLSVKENPQEKKTEEKMSEH